MAKSKKSRKQHPPHAPQYQPRDELLEYFEAAEQSFTNGNYEHAREVYRQILAADKRFTPALRQLALCEFQLGEMPTAIKHLSKYLKAVPEDSQAYAHIAQAYLMTGQTVKAKQNAALALRLEQTADFHFLAASIEERLNSPEKAIAQYELGLSLDPKRTSASLALGVIHKNLGNYGRAINLFEATLNTHPSHQGALSNLGSVYHAIGSYELAIEFYAKAQSSTPNADIAYNEGLSYQQLSDPINSLGAFRRALGLAPEHLAAKIQIAESLSTQGNFAEANKILDAVISDNAHHPMAWYLKTQYQQFTQEYSEIEKRLNMLSKQLKTNDDLCLVHFGLAKIYDDTQRYKLAFDHFQIANSQKAKSYDGIGKQQIADVTEPLLDFNDESLDDPEQDNALQSPIFIIGMPRSGTTLLERIISNSQNISSCGEVDYFGPALFRRKNELGEYRDSSSRDTLGASDLIKLRSGYLKRVSSIGIDSPLFVDKTPDNFRLVKMLFLLFPDARFIHCKRHALDTCLSIYFQLFQNLPYSYDLKNIAAYYLKYHAIVEQQRLAVGEKWLDVIYEDLVTNPSDLTSKLSSFLGCSIDLRDAFDSQSPTTISTMSRWQARQKIHKGAIGRWKFYSDNLSELKTALSEIL